MNRFALPAALAALASIFSTGLEARTLPQRNIIECDMRGCSDRPIARQTPQDAFKTARRHHRAGKRQKASLARSARPSGAGIEARTPPIPLPRAKPAQAEGVSHETAGTLAAYAEAVGRRAEVEPVRPGFAAVRTASGHRAVVASSAAWRFAGFLRQLEAAGYRIKDLGGYAYRRIAGTRTLSKHAFGLAVDVNQLGRNVVSARMPGNVGAMARRWGLTSGGDWRRPDLGHFEVEGSWPGHRRRVRYASAGR